MLADLMLRFDLSEREYRKLSGQDRQVARVLRSEGVRYMWPMNRLEELQRKPGDPRPTRRRIQAALKSQRKRMANRRERAEERAGDAPRPAGNPDLVVFLTTRNQMSTVREGLLALPPDIGVRVYARLPDVFDTAPFESRAFDTDYRPAATEKAMAFVDAAPRLARRLMVREAPAKPETVLELVLHLFMALDMIDDLKPRALLLSNDHSYPQRCLLAAAHLAGVPTAYIQHASVSPLFPRLDFDCAILDGASAARTYDACHANGADPSVVRRAPQVYLCGQQKTLRPAGAGTQAAGIAYNMHDDIDALNALVLRIGRSSPLRVRWHPRQGKEDIARIRQAVSEAGADISLSEPAEESVEDYLASLGCVVAGDSSILLEAAIAGCATVYHRTTDTLTDDYYGFVASGLARRAAAPEDVDRLVAEALAGSAPRPDPQAVRRYSETFGTPWMGREGELVANVLAAFLSGRAPGEPFVRKQIPGVGRFEVFGLPG